METPVVLVGHPQDNLLTPSLAISILKSSLAKRNIDCTAMYSHLLFAEIVGPELLEGLSSVIFYNLLLERVFAPYAHEEIAEVRLEELDYNDSPPSFHRICQIEGELKENIPGQKYVEIQDRCRIFLEKALEMIVSCRPRIVGFSNAFQPLNALIALAKKAKEHLSDSIFVIGGPNCDGPIGEEIARSIKIFDYVFQGEGDFVFAEFCHDYLINHIRPEKKLIQCPLPQNLDDVPVPDFSDYFRQCNGNSQKVYLPFESSRGCWWGEKHHCKFCGESKVTSGYRFKSPERCISELLDLQKKHPDISTYLSVDSVFPNSYFREFLPELRSRGFNKKIMFSSKPTLSSKNLHRISQDGIHSIFVGIESLSTRILHLVNKGTTALINVRFLRDCRENNVRAVWNFMVGLPGDRISDYEEQLQLLPFIQHFSPAHFRMFRLQRSSPYYERSEENSINEIRPLRDYYYAFPNSVDLTRLAYYFEGVYISEVRENPEVLLSIRKQLDRWNSRWENGDVPELSVRYNAGLWIVKDTRDCAKKSDYELNDDEYNFLVRCRLGMPCDRIGVSGMRLLDLGFLVEVDNKVLSVVCDDSANREGFE